MTTLSPTHHLGRGTAPRRSTPTGPSSSTAEARSRGGWSERSSGSSPDRARARALLLLLAYVVGSAVVAMLLAVVAGTAWRELLDWALPYLTPRALPG